MTRRTGIRCFEILAIMGVIDKDDAFLSQVITYYSDASTNELSIVIYNLLAKVYKYEQARTATMVFIKKLLDSHATRINWYDLLTTLIYNYGFDNIYECGITEALADHFLNEIIDHILNFQSNEENAKASLKNILDYLNKPRYIAIAKKFEHLFKYLDKETLPTTLVELTTTAIKAKEKDLAITLLKHPVSILESDQGSSK